MDSLGSNVAPAPSQLHGAARPSEQDGTYPRPQLLRSHWASLDGAWSFEYDDDDRGVAERWFDEASFNREIQVPFPPESRLSGIHDTTFHPVVWYARRFGRAELEQAGHADVRPRLLLHFGAVDYRADVWLDGHFLGTHEGGHTPFTFDVAGLVREDGDHLLVVRAEDHPGDVAKPRGKQDWMLAPHAVWYDRTTGIWQPVWIEAVPESYVSGLRWRSDVTSREVDVELRIAGPLPPRTTATVRLEYQGEELGEVRVGVSSGTTRLTIDLPAQANGQHYEALLWSPEHPRLIDATVTLSTGDEVASYLGLRSASVENGAFLLNERPYFVRSVLSQGFWPESHLAAPSADALRREAQLIKDLGFNAARVHQKIEDPRFLYWADRLGLLLWEELPSAYEFSPLAVSRAMTEWMEAIERDASHPSIVTWVPLNESWGVQNIAHSPEMRAFARALVQVTKAFDASRIVISNDGWEHVESDIVTVHDYDGDATALRARYADRPAIDRLLDGLGPAGRRMLLGDLEYHDQPVMLTEFGGIRFAPGDEGWGYTSASTSDDYHHQVAALVAGAASSSVLAGYCYTQLTDTQQEANGLCDENRVPKLPLDVFREVFRE